MASTVNRNAAVARILLSNKLQRGKHRMTRRIAAICGNDSTKVAFVAKTTWASAPKLSCMCNLAATTSNSAHMTGRLPVTTAEYGKHIPPKCWVKASFTLVWTEFSNFSTEPNHSEMHRTMTSRSHGITSPSAWCFTEQQ